MSISVKRGPHQFWLAHGSSTRNERFIKMMDFTVSVDEKISFALRYIQRLAANCK